MNPKISIIIPVYNVEKYLEDCLESIVNQSFKDIEIICINDGSTDNSLNILKKYKEIDNRVIIINQNNKGASKARNKGIINAKGEYILFVDSDDWIEKDTCQKLYSNALDNKSEVVLFNAIERFSNNNFRKRIYPIYNVKDYNNFTFDYTINKNLVMNSFMVIWSKFYKKSFLEENDLEFKGRLFNDNLFHITTMIKANRLSYQPDILYNYRKQYQSSLQTVDAQKRKSFIIFDIMDEVEEFLKLENVFDQLYINFINYKINESKNRLELIHPKLKKEVFNKIKNIFKDMNLDMNILNQIPKNLKEFYFSVLYSNFTELYNNHQVLTNLNELNNTSTIHSGNITNLNKKTESILEYLNIEKIKLQDEYSNLSNEYEELLSEYNNLTSKNNQLNKNYDSLNVKYQELSDDFSSLKKDYTTLDTEYKNLLNQNQKEKKINKQLNEANKELRTINHNLGINIDDLNIFIKEIKKENKSIIKNNNLLDDEIKTIKKQIEDNEDNISKLELERDNLHQQYQKIITENKKMKKELNNKDNLINSLEEQINKDKHEVEYLNNLVNNSKQDYKRIVSILENK